MKAMESTRIAELLKPFAGDLSENVTEQLRLYLDLLLRWNARVNLTAVRDQEEIVTRHFGESLFAARQLISVNSAISVADVGSGAGFPGVPIKLYAPQVRLTLIESQNKKATFLRELTRTLQLQGADVFCDRAERWGHTAEAVTLRAVEKFEDVLPIAAGLVAPHGRLCLLIGSRQFGKAQDLLGSDWTWRNTIAIPQSDERVVVIAEKSR